MFLRIAIIDADLIGRKRHRFPNLVCMKLSGYYKAMGNEVLLKTDYDGLEIFDQVYIAKVFTDTKIPTAVLSLPNVKYGGTGFFYDKAPPLLEAIEHHKPDYHLYDDWVEDQIVSGKRRQEFRYYTDYAIGYLTRGCFRHCGFCVNKNYSHVLIHSPLEEFMDASRKKICLLDDNFFGCPMWKSLLLELRQTKLPFQFKQGLDERLLTDERCELLFSSQSSNSGNEQSVLSESGWKRFSDGLTIEWGSASGTGKHVFPRAFTKVFSVTITKNNDNSGSAPGVDTIITGTDNTGFYTRIQKMWDTQYNGASLSDDWHNVYYIAVGIS